MNTKRIKGIALLMVPVGAVVVIIKYPLGLAAIAGALVLLVVATLVITCGIEGIKLIADSYDEG